MLRAYVCALSSAGTSSDTASYRRNRKRDAYPSSHPPSAIRHPPSQNRSLKIAFITDAPHLDALARDAFEPCGHALYVVTCTQINHLPRDASVVFVDLGTGDGALRLTAKKIPRAIALGRCGTAEETIAAMRAGARDYVAPDVTVEALRAALARLDGLLPPPIFRARVEYRHADCEPRSRSLIRGATLTLGRDPRNDIVFDSPFVSRFHARIESRFGYFEIVDRGSHNGVFIGNEKVEGGRALADGDVIRLGMPSAPELLVRVEYASPGEDEADSARSGPSSDEAGRELKSLAQLLDTFLQLNTDLLLDDVLALVIDRSIEFAGAERGMILLHDLDSDGLQERTSPRLVIETGSQQTLTLVMARNGDGSDVATEQLDISQKLPQEVLATGTGMMVEDLLVDDRVGWHAQTIEFGVRSAMCVPLRVRRTGAEETASAPVLGVLYVDSSLRSHPFSERLLHALESLASEAAHAIHGARLYRVSLEKRRIDEEMRLAREIQEGLLPSQTYTNAWVELCGTSVPSREVGGDVLDYFPSASRIGLLVGDVSGKGVPAAIFSSMLGGHFHAPTELLGAEGAT